MSDPDAFAKNDYRFTGYDFPKLQLDETGAQFIVTGINPYYINQPTFWQKPSYGENLMIGTGPEASTLGNANSMPNGRIDYLRNSQTIPTFATPKPTSTSPKLFKMRPI